MKKLKKILKNPMLLNSFAMLILVYAAGTRCCWIGHQPEMPDEVRKFKRH